MLNPKVGELWEWLGGIPEEGVFEILGPMLEDTDKDTYVLARYVRGPEFTDFQGNHHVVGSEMKVYHWENSNKWQLASFSDWVAFTRQKAGVEQSSL